MAKFGEILQELRKDNGLSQQDLGKILHVTPGTISNYENSVSLPGVERLVEMADYFQVSTDYLLGRCSSRLSPDAWNQAALGERTVGELIHTIRGLTPDQRGALALIISDMALRATITRYQGSQQGEAR